MIQGPPGCGKTSLANVLSFEASKAQNNKWRFTRLSACNSGVAQVKEEVSKAKNERSLFKRSTMLFIDEIHNLIGTRAYVLLVVLIVCSQLNKPILSLNKSTHPFLIICVRNKKEEGVMAP